MSALVEKPLTEILRTEFQDEDYRYAYDEEFSNARMATQIKVLRESKQPTLKQVELAERAGMKQSRISELENVNYNSWSVSTLRRLARALGVRFFFGFESWGELLPEIKSFSRDSLERPSFDEDTAFKDEPVKVGKPDPFHNKIFEELKAEGQNSEVVELLGRRAQSEVDKERMLKVAKEKEGTTREGNTLAMAASRNDRR